LLIGEVVSLHDVGVHRSALTSFTSSQIASDSSPTNDGSTIAGKSWLESGGERIQAKLLMT
jgi:hypothetical protein